MPSRVRFLLPALALAATACTHVTYVYPDGTPAPAPQQQQPAPQPLPVEQPVPQPQPEPVRTPVYRTPLAVTLGRPVSGQLVMHTNRRAYVALFEIVPDVGVRMIRPSSTFESRRTSSSVTTVRQWWTSTVQPASRVTTRTVAQEPEPERYVFAIASDEPLLLPDSAFRPGYLRRLLGPRLFAASQPYQTMRALSRRIVPDVYDEQWAEDVLVIAPSEPRTAPQQLARVYCPDGTRFEVPAEMADEVTCPGPERAPGAPVGRGDDNRRPDSVYVGGRRRTPMNPPRGRGPIDRVREPVVAGNGGRGPQSGTPGNAGGQGNGDNGNHNGHANGNNGNNGRSGEGNASGNGNGRGRGNGGARVEPTVPVLVPMTRDSLRMAPPERVEAPKPQEQPRTSEKPAEKPKENEQPEKPKEQEQPKPEAAKENGKPAATPAPADSTEAQKKAAKAVQAIFGKKKKG